MNALDTNSSKLYLHVSPYYANNILIPRLHEFTEQHPHIDLRISIGAENTDFNTKTSISPYSGAMGNGVDFRPNH